MLKLQIVSWRQLGLTIESETSKHDFQNQGSPELEGDFCDILEKAGVLMARNMKSEVILIFASFILGASVFQV